MDLDPDPVHRDLIMDLVAHRRPETDNFREETAIQKNKKNKKKS
jgi:hypothetical protein